MTEARAGTLVWIEYNPDTMTDNDKAKLKRHGPLWMVRNSSVAGDRLQCESMKDQAIHVWYLTEVRLK